MESENTSNSLANFDQDFPNPETAGPRKVTSYERKSSVQSTLAPDLEIIIPTEQSFSWEREIILRTNFSGTPPSTT